MNESPLTGPLSRVLVDPVSEAALGRMWRHVSRRRERPPELLVALRWLCAGFVAALAVTALAVGIWRGPSKPASVASSGPLLQQNGQAVGAVEAPEGGASSRLSLADGSAIQVEAGGRLEPLASSGSEFVLRLVRGRASFEVVPGGPRRWVIEAGIARVEVVGTRFRVARSAGLVQVQVERGIVLVRSVRLPDGVARIEAGQAVEVRDDPAPGSPTPEARNPLPAPAPSRSPRAAAPGWREEAALGRHVEAYALLGSSGLEREARLAASLEDLFTLADVARLSGHPERARAPLERLLEAYPREPRAALAAATLGRIELDLGHPGNAARAFERALAIGAPVGLEEDLRVRLVESWSRAGDRGRARAAAESYAKRFPNGRRQAELERWLSASP